MCVIIEKPADVTIDKYVIDEAFWTNKDGFGYMYAEDGRIVSDKWLPKTATEVWEVVEKLQDKHLVLHFRITTHGETEERQCHPFRVLSKESNGVDLFMMHNGMIQQHGNVHDDNVSDTIEFIREIVRPITRRNPHIIHVDAFQTMLEDYVSTSKLIFMDGDGVVTRMNDALWSDYKGLRCSNLHFISYGYGSNSWSGGGYYRNGGAQQGMNKVDTSGRDWSKKYKFLNGKCYIEDPASGEFISECGEILIDDHGVAAMYGAPKNGNISVPDVPEKETTVLGLPPGPKEESKDDKDILPWTYTAEDLMYMSQYQLYDAITDFPDQCIQAIFDIIAMAETARFYQHGY